MKLIEVAEERDAHLEKLKAAIEADERPTIIPASYSRGNFSWGDLKELGWAHREQKYISAPAYYEVWWTYTGPNPIIVNYGKSQVEMQDGDEETPVTVDLS